MQLIRGTQRGRETPEVVRRGGRNWKVHDKVNGPVCILQIANAKALGYT